MTVGTPGHFAAKVVPFYLLATLHHKLTVIAFAQKTGLVVLDLPNNGGGLAFHEHFSRAGNFARIRPVGAARGGDVSGITEFREHQFAVYNTARDVGIGPHEGQILNGEIKGRVGTLPNLNLAGGR